LVAVSTRLIPVRFHLCEPVLSVGEKPAKTRCHSVVGRSGPSAPPATMSGLWARLWLARARFEFRRWGGLFLRWAEVLPRIVAPRRCRQVGEARTCEPCCGEALLLGVWASRSERDPKAPGADFDERAELQQYQADHTAGHARERSVGGPS